MPLNKPALRVLNNTNFPNNTTQYISPELLREFNSEMITSMELTQSMSDYAVLEGGNAFIGSQSIDGNVSIDKGSHLNTNGIYWNNSTVGYTNLEIVNSSPVGNVNIGAINGKVQIVSSSLNITNGTFTASLQDGYTYVGNGSGRTQAVSTSSFASNINTGSFLTTSSFNAYTSSNDTKWNTLGGQTGSFVTSAITGSSLITASFSGNTLTFTKGDSSTFGVVIPDVSGSTINTGSFATTGSNNFIGSQTITSSLDGLTFLGYDNRLNFGSNTNTDRAWLNLTQSDGRNQGTVLQFTGANTGVSFGVNDTATPSTGSTPVAFENSSRSGSITFRNYGNNGEILLKNDTGSIRLNAGGIVRVSGSATLIQDVDFIPFSSSLNSRILAITGSSINTGSFATTGSNLFRGTQTIETGSGNNYLQVGTGNRNVKTEFNAITITNPTQANVTFNAPDTYWLNSGNLYFQNFDSFDVGSGSVNFSLKNGGSYSTLANGGGSISFTAGTGSISLTTPGEINLQGAVRIKQKDGSNAVTVVNSSGSLLLSAASYTSASLHLSQSSATQNTSVNFVFKTNNNTPDTIISGSNNIFVNPAAPTAGFKRYFGGSGNIVLQTAAPEISASMAFSPTMNNNIWSNASILMRGPVSSSAWTISNNFGNASQHAIGTAAGTPANQLVSGLTFTNNFGGGFNQVTAWKTPLSASVTYSNNLNASAPVALNCDSSSIAYAGNISSGQVTINNSYLPGTVTNASGVISVSTNTIFGTTIINASGSNTTFTGTPRTAGNNIIGGYSTIGLVLNGDNSSLNSSAVVGGGLVVTGSNSRVAGATANNDFGSAFFGRWNDVNGSRATSGPTVFAVGTGTSTTRKTGFLIDSGSNTFVEGTLNVSGSSSFTGSASITGNLIVSGNTQFNVGAFQSGITQSGSAAVSQSMTFNTTDYSSGVSLNGGGTQFVIANKGVYNIQFSAQILADTGADIVWIWLKQNGVNVPNTAGKVVLANNEESIQAWNYVVPANASDYFELVWQNNSGHANLQYIPASGNIPAAASVIASITQVR